MDIRRAKLWLALRILTLGMIVALVWHGWQRWVLHRGYPYDTFLFLPSVRFYDLLRSINYDHYASSYVDMSNAYLPASYCFFDLFLPLTLGQAVLVYDGLCMLGICWLTARAVAPLCRDESVPLLSKLRALVVGIALTWLSYPFLMGLDRANLELALALSVGGALLCFQRGRPNLGMLCLFPAICFKLYPALLLVLYWRPGYFRRILFIAALAVGLNCVSLLHARVSVMENLALWRQSLDFIQDYCVIHDGQLHGSASPWNAGKVWLKTYCYIAAGMPPGQAVLLPADFMRKLFSVYEVLWGIFTIAVVAFGVLCEKEFFRRAGWFLLLMTMSVPSGGDYRLLYANIALLCWILLPTRRRHDFWIVGLLAFVVVPKREGAMDYLGITSAHCADVTISVFLNVPCMLLALALMMWDGWREERGRFWWQRLSSRSGPFRFLFRA